MSRWIDADALKYYGRNDFQYVDRDQIDSAPSIDIVRCRECEHWSGCKSTMHNNHLCGRAEKQNVDYWTSADDFCSYGEREGE